MINSANTPKFFQSPPTFIPISISNLTTTLTTIDWKQRIYKLDRLYIFKFNVSQFISSNLWLFYHHFIQEALKYVTLKTYSYLLMNDQQAKPMWQEELVGSSQRLKGLYCELMRKIRERKKVFVLDVLVFLCSLLSREILGNFLQQSKKKPPRTQIQALSELQNYQKLCLQNSNTEQQKNLLLVQQYTFIIITYQTTGNKVSPNSFQYMKNKLVQRIKISHKCTSFVISLKIIRQHIQKKKNQIQLKRTGMIISKNQDKDSYSPQQCLAQIVQILCQKQDPIVRKSIYKQDKVSLSLHQLLQVHNDNNNNQPSLFYNNLEKINCVKLSRAIQFNYTIQEKDLSLLERNKKKSESLMMRRNRSHYWRQIKSIEKPVFHIRSKIVEGGQETGEGRKNWEDILRNQKKKFKRSGIEVEKFKSMSNYVDKKQKTSRSNSLTSLNKTDNKFLPNLQPNNKQKNSNHLPLPLLQQLQPLNNDKKPQKQLASTSASASALSQSNKQNTSYIFNQITEKTTESALNIENENDLTYCNTSKQNKAYSNSKAKANTRMHIKDKQYLKDNDYLRKKVFDIKKFKKAFQDKCRLRHEQV